MTKKDLISICDLTKQEILYLLKSAAAFKKEPRQNVLAGKIMASCFYEPSTRTRLSFESAMLKLGGNVIGFTDGNATSSKKGESLADSMKIISSFADLIVVRHPQEGSARLASESAECPVINAGDGANQHPTQTLLDLFTIKESQKKLEGLKIALVGDLKYGRTMHSLAFASSFFNMRLYLIAPEILTMPEYILQTLRKRGVKFSFHKTIEEVIGKIDVLYLTRFQKERMDKTLYEEVKSTFILKKEMLKGAKKNLKILHPLPRIDEMEKSIDHTPYATYFEQAANGVFVRQAILTHLL